MTGNAKLDMSLDALIKKAKKPAGGAKKQAGPAVKKAPAAGNKGKAGGQKPQQIQKAGAKGKVAQQTKQPAQKQGLKARGGIQKAGVQKAVRPAAKPLPQQRPGQKRADVRVVPRPAARPAARPLPRPSARPMPQPRFMGPASAGSRYMGGPQMMPGMMQQQPMMMMQQQQPMMMQRQPMMMQQQPMMMPQQQQPQQQQQQAAKWPTELFDGSVVSSKTSSKLLVSNLDYKVTDEDIKELFGTVGIIKESYIHYDKNGRSLGTATVVFQNRDDALNAFNRYNNVALDNKRMAIEVVEQAVPRGTFKTLASGINVSKPQAAGASYRGRGVPQGDMMME